jgi:hypothetical protein
VNPRLRFVVLATGRVVLIVGGILAVGFGGMLGAERLGGKYGALAFMLVITVGSVAYMADKAYRDHHR